MNRTEIINIDGIECYEKDGTAYLKLETIAKGLGFTETKNGKSYVMWRRVSAYLNELGFGTSAERPEFIPENIFYRLAMKAKNEVAEKFQAKVADEIIPTIRRTGGYINNADLMVNTYFSDISDDQKGLVKGLLSNIEEQQKKILYLSNENDLLSQKNLEWADRSLINSLVRAYASSVGGNFGKAWNDFKKELLYKHGINLNSRITNYLNSSGKKTRPKTLSMLDDSEIPNAISTIVSMCRENEVKVDDLISNKAG